MRTFRVYANGDWKWQEETNIGKHESERPGTALVVNGIIVYPGIGVSKEKISHALGIAKSIEGVK